MSYVHPRAKVSVYKDGTNYRDIAYDENQKFSVFTPVQKDNVLEMLKRYERDEKEKKLRESRYLEERRETARKEAAKKVRVMNTSPKNSPANSPKKEPTTDVVKFDLKSANSPEDTVKTEPDQITPTNGESKVKNRLMKDVEKAEEYYNVTSPTQAKRQNPMYKSYDSSNSNAFKAVEGELRASQTIQHDSQGKNGKLPQSKSTQQLLNIKDSINQRTGFSDMFSTKSGKSMGGRSRRSYISYKSSSSILRDTLYFNARTKAIPKSTIKNPIIENILHDEHQIISNPGLLDNIIQLRDMDLLSDRHPLKQAQKANSRIPYVYNDYHQRNTNPGYSRNTAGCFFFR